MPPGRAPPALVDLLPPDLRAGLRRALREGHGHLAEIDLLPLVLETRLLRPLHGFGLLEWREVPREPAAWRERLEYRPTPLLARTVRFALAADRRR